MKNLTPWFDGKLYKPVRPGVYQSRFFSDIGFRHWDGKTWGNWFFRQNDAARRKHRPAAGAGQTDDWRGICKPDLSMTGFLERMAEHLRDEMPPMETLRYQAGLRSILWNSLSKQAEHIYLSRYEKETK